MDRKALSLPILTSLVVGNMIGTGIYVLPSSLAKFGTISLLAWIFTSLGAVFLALTFANLNKRYPQTGGPYVFCKEAYGRLAGFTVAYLYWISVMVSVAGIAISSVAYLGFVTPILNANSAQYHPLFVLGIELGLVWLFTLVNIIGLHAAGVVQLCLTIAKLAPLLIVVLFGLSYVQLDNITHFAVENNNALSAISGAAVLTFWAFIGLESATIPAENTSGHKDVQRATIIGTVMTAFVYLLSSFVLMGMIPATQLQTSQFPFADAGILIFGQHAALVIAICALVSGIGALNGCILIQGQVIFAAARDKLFPRYFAKISKRDVPIAAHLLSSTLVSLFILLSVEPTLLKQFENIAILAALFTLLTYLATSLSEVKFILQDKGKLTWKRLNTAMLVALLAAGYSLWMIFSIELKIIIAAGLLMLLCIPLYFVTLM